VSTKDCYKYLFQILTLLPPQRSVKPYTQPHLNVCYYHTLKWTVSTVTLPQTQQQKEILKYPRIVSQRCRNVDFRAQTW